MNGAAVAAIIAVAIVAVGGGAAYAMGVFDKDGGSGGDDDWTAHVGDQVTYEASGTQTYWERGFISYHKVTIDFTGTNTNTLLYYDEGKGWWFINYASVRDYTYQGRPIQHIENDSNEWGMDEDLTEEIIGTKEIDTIYGKKTCQVVKLENLVTGHTEIQYSDDEHTYLVEVTITSGAGYNAVVIETTLYLKSTTKVEVDIENSVTLYADNGITVTGAGTYNVGEEVTVTAAGDDFYGWYDFNVSADTPLSTERTYTFNITRDTSLYALTGAADKSYESGAPVTLQSGKDLADATWTITMYDRTLGVEVSTDTVQGASPTYTFDIPGDYRVKIVGTTVSGEAYNGFRALYVDGYLTNTYELKVGSATETMELSILFSDYVKYMDKMDANERKDDPRHRQEHSSQFVVADTLYIKQVADYFLGLKEKYSLTDIEMAAAVLSMVQYIPYEYDINTHGISEYWNYPLETLYLKIGDCEDGSILCSAILKALGFKSCLINMYGHMAVGFLGTDMGGFSEWEADTGYKPFTPGGYYYGETTSTNRKLGEVPDGVIFIDEIPIGTGYDEEKRIQTGASWPRPKPLNPFPYREYMSSRDTRRTFGSFDAMSLRSTENPAAENIT